MALLKKISNNARDINGETGARSSRLGIRSIFKSASRTSRSPASRISSQDEHSTLGASDTSSVAPVASSRPVMLPVPSSTAASITLAAPVTSPPQITTHGPGAMASSSKAPAPSSRASSLNASRVDDVHDFVTESDVWSTAFRRACASRPKTEREQLARTKDLVELFEKLQKRNSKHEETSIFQKGVKMVGPILNGLNFVLNLADPVSSIEPSASSALAIVKMVATVAIAVCGAAQEMSNQIKSFLKDLPRIDYCDAVQSGSLRQDIVQEPLIAVYDDLLDFFFHCCGLLDSKVFLVAATKSQIQGKITAIVQSFSQHLTVLDNSINAATHEIATRLLDNDIDREVQELLKPDNTKEIELYNILQIRTNRACSWIDSNDVFQDWLRATPGIKHVIMYGDMGSGKTFTVAYIVDCLRSGCHIAASPLVCSYFCKDDGEMNQTITIYRSLLRQLLKAKESFKWDFHQWHKQRRSGFQVDPTQVTDEIRKLLIRLIQSLRQAVYIVIDALDECSEEAKTNLNEFFELVRSGSGLHTGHQGLVRVFTSSRYVDRSRDTDGITTINMPHDLEREKEIVRHLSLRHLAKLTTPICNLIVDEVTQRMQGSAIWATLVIQYLHKTCSRTTKESSLTKMLQDIPTPQALSALYAKLFEKIVDGEDVNRWILAQSLDILAGARRQLTLRELSYAVCMEIDHPQKAKTLGEIVDVAEDYGRILDLIRPFVSMKESPDGEIDPTAYVRLFHHSLKQVILCSSPHAWSTSAAPNLARKKVDRTNELNSLVLHLCMDYLLLAEFGTQELAPNREAETFLQETMVAYWGFDNESEESLGSSIAHEDFDPYEKGFGGFYTYAACYWTIHYEAVDLEYTPDLADLIALSQPGSLRMKNWLDRMRRPDWRVDLEIAATRGCNPLHLVAWFGTEPALCELLDKGFDALGLEDQDLRDAVIDGVAAKAIERQRFYVVEVLLRHPTTSNTLKSVGNFLRVAFCWPWLLPGNIKSWEHLLDSLIGKSRSVLVADANLILLHAARAGCLPMVKRLFEVAELDQQIKKRLLEKTEDDWGPIGRAGCFGHVDVVRYLCQQTGIESHLHHRDRFGDSVYVIVSQNGNAEVLKVLIQYFPEAVNEANGSTTPLQHAVNAAQSIEAARMLLLEGKADVNAGDPYFMPLRCAVRNGRMDMCRMLITEGNAGPWTVVGVSDMGLPFLREAIQAPMSTNLIDEQHLLKQICTLMPLAVSVVALLPTGDSIWASS